MPPNLHTLEVNLLCDTVHRWMRLADGGKTTSTFNEDPFVYKVLTE